MIVATATRGSPNDRSSHPLHRPQPTRRPADHEVSAGARLSRTEWVSRRQTDLARKRPLRFGWGSQLRFDQVHATPFTRSDHDGAPLDTKRSTRARRGLAFCAGTALQIDRRSVLEVGEGALLEGIHTAPERLDPPLRSGRGSSMLDALDAAGRLGAGAGHYAPPAPGSPSQ